MASAKPKQTAISICAAVLSTKQILIKHPKTVLVVKISE